jgi:hypothetical protein
LSAGNEYILTRKRKSIISIFFIIQGSTVGGLEVRLQGSYLPVSTSDRNITVKIGSSPCKVISSSNKEVLIETGPKIDSSEIRIMYNGQESVAFEGFVFDDSSAPTIESIDPHSWSPSLKRDILIKGLNFGSIKDDIKVTLFNMDPAGHSYELSVVSVKDNEILAVLGGGRTGKYKLTVTKRGVGKSLSKTEGADLFKYEILLDEVSPNSGSYLGGTVLTIKGKNFSPSPNQNQVFIGVDNVMCRVKESSPTQITCVTQRATEDSTDVVSNVFVAQRIQDEATCTNPDKCKFKYYKEGAPNIVIDPSKTVRQVLAGDDVVLEGENLGMSVEGTIFKGEVGRFMNNLTYSS